IYAINTELATYNAESAERPQFIAANKIDMIYTEDDPVAKIRAEFEPKGIQVYAISAISGQGLRELLYAINNALEKLDCKPVIFEQEFFPEFHFSSESDPFTVIYDEEEDAYVVEGPRIEKMLSYTNLESEKGFKFFQDFLKDNGILEQLESLGISEGDTVRMYGLSFDYYK
ncbi:MAG: Obg family GTPase CgtA, partial [Lachnospiraceae bacterium]|nr:Obg family GTPase CgtA [Lachnospiraceae bacterium]